MAKFKRGNLDLNTNQKIRLGDSLESFFQFDGSNLIISNPNGDVAIDGNLTTDSLDVFGSGLQLESGSRVDGVLTSITVDDSTATSALVTASAVVDYVSGIDTPNPLNVGVEDTTKGIINVYSAAPDTEGGEVRLHVNTNHVDNDNYYGIKVTSNTLVLGDEGGSYKIVLNGASQQWDFYASSDVKVSLDGNGFTYDDAFQTVIDNAPSSNQTITGEVVKENVVQNTRGKLGLVALDTDGNWIDADADSTAVGMLALTVQSGVGPTESIVLRGIARDDSWSFTPGAQLFVSTTPGEITQIEPSTPGEIRQVVGYARTATIIFFNPSPDFSTVT